MKQNKDSDLLTPDELVERWKGSVTTGTLANWRVSSHGPPYKKIGSSIRYSLNEVILWESKQTR